MPDATETDIRIPVTNQMIAAGVDVLREYAMPRDLAERVARRIFIEMAINAPLPAPPSPAMVPAGD